MNLKSWLPELALRTLRVIAIGFMLLNGWSVYKAFEKDGNPLIPDTIPHYIAFPHFCIISFYGAVMYIIWKFLKAHYESKHWWIPVVIVFFFEFFKFYIYGFLMWINPFG